MFDVADGTAVGREGCVALHRTKTPLLLGVARFCYQTFNFLSLLLYVYLLCQQSTLSGGVAVVVRRRCQRRRGLMSRFFLLPSDWITFRQQQITNGMPSFLFCFLVAYLPPTACSIFAPDEPSTLVSQRRYDVGDDDASVYFLLCTPIFIHVISNELQVPCIAIMLQGPLSPAADDIHIAWLVVDRQLFLRSVEFGSAGRTCVGNKNIARCATSGGANGTLTTFFLHCFKDKTNIERSHCLVDE
mmetsp:Transcript_28564/g.53728  ORF Transcript_28564/g.53728 Transcript_28564/m.53728 type:complete len:244 (+) Transcript_28564:585-1316(+)